MRHALVLALFACGGAPAKPAAAPRLPAPPADGPRIEPAPACTSIAAVASAGARIEDPAGDSRDRS